MTRIVPLARIEDDFRTEVVRKSIHASGILVPWIYYYTDRGTAVWIIAALTAVAIAIDLGRRGDGAFARWFGTWLGPILRDKERTLERRWLHAATWFFVVCTVLIAYFPKYVAILAISVLIAGDAAAALVGRRLGRHRVWGRSLEGSAAFLAAALLVMAVTPRLQGRPEEYALCAVAALVGAAAELLSRDPLEDNVTVPLSVGVSLWLMYAWVLPWMNLDAYGVR